MMLVRQLALTALAGAAIGCGNAGNDPSPDNAGGSSSNPLDGAGGSISTSGGQAGSAFGGGASGDPRGMGGNATAGTADGAAGGVKAGAAGMAGSNAGGPAPPAAWINATGNLAGMASDCYNMGRVAIKPGSSRIIAGVALHGLFASDDGGKSWQALGTGAGSAKITNRVSSITFDREDPDVFWETGTHTGAGFYKTTDGGLTFKQLGTMTFSQDAAIDFADPARKTMLTGTHGKGIFRSTDAGQTFTDISAGVPGNTLWPLLIDAQTYLIGTFDAEASNAAVYRTTNGGASWSQVTALSPSHDGTFRRTSDDSLYLPISANAGIMKSVDLGKTWTRLASAGATFPPAFFSVTTPPASRWKAGRAGGRSPVAIRGRGRNLQANRRAASLQADGWRFRWGDVLRAGQDVFSLARGLRDRRAARRHHERGVRLHPLRLFGSCVGSVTAISTKSARGQQPSSVTRSVTPTSAYSFLQLETLKSTPTKGHTPF